MKRTALIATLAAALLAGGCGGDDGGGGGKPSKVDKANQQAAREFDACMKQADQIADSQGAEAGSAKLDECVTNRANETLVEP